jgi:hypothetical protein
VSSSTCERGGKRSARTRAKRKQKKTTKFIVGESIDDFTFGGSEAHHHIDVLKVS